MTIQKYFKEKESIFCDLNIIPFKSLHDLKILKCISAEEYIGFHFFPVLFGLPPVTMFTHQKQFRKEITR
jgi:hypothetical protein